MTKQPPLLRVADLVADTKFGSGAAIARAFTPALSRAAVSQWGEYLPPDRARELLSRHPELYELQVDEQTGMTMKQMRERIEEAGK